MSKLNDKEYAACLLLNADYRQSLFIDSVTENQGLYILVDSEGPLILEDTEEDDEHNLFSVLPVWSDDRLAEGYAESNKLENMKAQFVTLKAWNESWVPMFQEQKNVLIGFMPVTDKDFSVDDPHAF